MGIKTSGTVQVLCMHWPFALKLDYILIKYEKPQKNMPFLVLSIFADFSILEEFERKAPPNSYSLRSAASFDTPLTSESG